MVYNIKQHECTSSNLQQVDSLFVGDGFTENFGPLSKVSLFLLFFVLPKNGLPPPFGGGVVGGGGGGSETM